MRPWQLEDLDDFFEYASHPEVGPCAGWPPHIDKNASLEILKSFINTGEVWALFHKQDKKVIGSLGLHEDKLRKGVLAKSMGYVLSKGYWNLGLATEAAKHAVKHVFEDMNLELLAVYHYPFNQRSKRVIEKCGFICEGTLRHAVKLYDGRVYSAVCYSMLRSEYALLHLNEESRNDA